MASTALPVTELNPRHATLVTCEAPLNSASFSDVLDCVALAVLLAEAGDDDGRHTALMEAHLAATAAFPPGTRGAEALLVILSAAARVAAVTA